MKKLVLNIVRVSRATTTGRPVAGTPMIQYLRF